LTDPDQQPSSPLSFSDSLLLHHCRNDAAAFSASFGFTKQYGVFIAP
jgi:hypothetical protein